jgi:hypothetical protein
MSRLSFKIVSEAAAYAIVSAFAGISVLVR